MSKGAAFLNFLPAYWEMLLHWSVSFGQLGLTGATASASGLMQMSAVVSVPNRQASYCRVKTSNMLKQKHHPST